MAIVTYPHGPLVPLASNLWTVTAATSQGLPRRMTVARGTGGELFVHDPLWLDDATFAALDRLGPVAAIFVPGWLHDFDAERYAERSPNATLCAAPPTVRKLRWPRLVAVEPSMLPAGMALGRIPGVKSEMVLEVAHPEGGVSLVLGDVLFNLPHASGWRGLILRLLGSSGPLHMTPLARAFLLADRAAFRGWLEAQAARPELRHVLVAHGDAVSGDAGPRLAAAAARL